ncbi:MAG TPA: SusC/RagA family TonB-linked outer membrane protein [Balneolaceae bacterium]|nr:SusC/RagA family TonB-linked outer membrane protein [Balneolaceae bacterium]
MTKRILQSALMLLVASTFMSATALAQSGSITGTIIDNQSSEVLPGANVFISSLNRGTATDNDGSFTISNVPYGSYQVKFSFIGYNTKKMKVTVDQNTVDLGKIALSQTVKGMNDVVVTAYGIKQSRNELPYSAQQVDAETINQGRSGNLLTSLNGRVAGLKVSKSNGMGGSTNIVMRGYKSISGNNQVLFVVDGVPYSNHTFNDANQKSGFSGYDYGNTAYDINPDNVKSINVLKGPAAAALYGSRASNGAVVIQTKKAKTGQKKVDVTFNTSLRVSKINKNTFPTYQQKYGAGYCACYSDGNNPQFLVFDANGDGQKDLVAPYTADASMGARFDPNKMVYQWDSFLPTSTNYGQPSPWTPAEHSPVNFFNTGYSGNNSLSIDGGFPGGYYSLGYNQTNQTGIMPNSKLDKYKLNFSAGYDVSDKLHVDASINYANTDGRGRYGTGYGTIMSSFRQWYETNVDILHQKQAYFRNQRNNTWNLLSDRSGPFYWNNPYWERYQNYETDQRDRYFGYADIKYDVANWLSITGRVSLDSYNELIGERINKGSVGVSSYTRTSETFSEFNYDLLANYNKQLTQAFTISGVVGANIRRNHMNHVDASTNGGLVVPGLFSLDNSVSSILYPNEVDTRLGVNGYFASFNLNYNDYLNLELTGRRDKSSSLPKGENVYYYPSASLGFIFSQFIDADWLSFGKIRGSVASVGNTAPPHSVIDTYNRPTNFNSQPRYTLPATKNNPNLKPEQTKSWEVGLQMSFFQDRLSFDANYYDENTLNQILRTAISRSSGYSYKYVNAGNVQNRGLSLTVTAKPVVSRNFAWTINANWNKNINTVKELAPGVNNYQLADPQGDVTISAAKGEPYGAIRGSDFKYKNGQPIVGSNGFYESTSSSNHIIGNMEPDWTGGITNRFNYKNWTLNFLIDVRWGGDIFSLDQYYGQATGLYPVTASTNDNGKNVRDPVSQGGGVVLDGVNQDGSKNDIHAPASSYFGAFGYYNEPSANFVYDGSYVKLRQVGLTYHLPQDLISKIGILSGASLSAVGNNLWIIYKNLPYSDPEQGISAGSVQGYQGAAQPATRDVTFNLKLKF